MNRHENITKLKDFLQKHIYIQLILNAFVLTFILEMLNRKSPATVLKFMGKSPLTYVCNMVIILLTLCISLYFRKMRNFMQGIISLIWILLGSVNFFILGYRMTPFSAEDLKLITMLMKIMQNYLTPGLAILLAAALVTVITAIILMWRKLPKDQTKRSFISVASHTGVIALALYAFINMGMQTSALSENFENLAEAYEDYGFAYCFSNSLVNVGISQPAGYSKDTMYNIADLIREKADFTEDSFASASYSNGVSAERPNIIMIQLESFFDPNLLKNFSYSENPDPFFQSLKENYSSGYFHVPVVGAGTANTEFEILTGMSTDYFGAGEYPFNTVLKSNTDESLPNILKNYGYTSEVIHNNTGSFYNRSTIFSQLGFNRFIPKEYMYNLVKTPTNWAKDEVIPDMIMESLESTEGQDFVYTITVQTHGRYPVEQVLEDPAITVTAADPDVNINPLTYYVNQVKDVDNMLKDLVSRLEASGEPTVLVLYGDHLPAMGFEEEDIALPTLYSTEYVIWDNIGLEKEDRSITTESIGTLILSKFGMTNGIMPLFHKAFDGTYAYDKYLNLLEYDMLYGKGYIYDAFSKELGFVPTAEEQSRAYQASYLKFGVREISVSSTEIKGDYLYVYGNNFNQSSHIMIDGKVRNTEYISNRVLKLDASIPDDIDELCVAQCDSNDRILGDTTNSLYHISLNEGIGENA